MAGITNGALGNDAEDMIRTMFKVVKKNFKNGGQKEQQYPWWKPCQDRLKAGLARPPRQA